MTYRPPFARMRQISQTARPVEWPVVAPQVEVESPAPVVEAPPVVVAETPVTPPEALVPTPPVEPEPAPAPPTAPSVTWNNGMTKKELLAVARKLKLELPANATKNEVLAALGSLSK